MLILYRRTNEEIVLKIPGYSDVTLKFLRCENNSVRLGIEAEKRILIMRSELLTEQPATASYYEARLREDEENLSDDWQDQGADEAQRFYKPNIPRTTRRRYTP